MSFFLFIFAWLVIASFTYILAKVFFVSIVGNVEVFNNAGLRIVLAARALFMRYALSIWADTPYQSECGVYRSLPRYRFFHNLPQDKRK